MSVYMTEEEQLERIKQWFKQYGNLLLTIVLAVTVVVAGWQWWHHRQYKISSQASQAYEQLLNQLSNDDTSMIESRANSIIQDYPKTIYADIAKLILARTAVYQGNLTEAAEQLQKVIRHTRHASLKQVARIRAARVLLEQAKYDEALKMLDTIDAEQYAPLVAETRGDIFLAKGALYDARQAYALALQKLPGSGVTKPVLDMKLHDLPGNNL